MSAFRSNDCDLSDNTSLHTDYFLNLKGDFWKIQNGRGKFVNGKSGNDCSKQTSSDEFYVTPSSQPLALWEHANTINTSPSTDNNDSQISEMELMIAKVKLYVLQLEAQLSSLKAKKKTMLEPRTKHISTTPPLVTIHRIPQSMDMKSFRNNMQTMVSVSSERLLTAQPHNNLCNKNIATIAACPEANLTTSDGASMPCLSPFFNTSPGHYRRCSGINSSSNSSEQLSELSIVIAPSEREMANNFSSHVPLNIEENKQSTLVRNSENMDLNNVGIKTKKKIPQKTIKRKLLPTDCQSIYDASPFVQKLDRINNKAVGSSPNKYPRSKRAAIINKSTEKQSPFILLAKKKINSNERDEVLLPISGNKSKSISFLQRSYSSSDEKTLFKDSYSSDDGEASTNGIKNKIIPRKVFKSPSKIPVNDCYIKLVHGYKYLDGMKIYT